jgi:hypothetical protein
MREFDRAVGRIAGYCSAVGADYNGGMDQQGRHVLRVQHRGGIFSIWAGPTEGHFTAQSERRLTNIEGFDVTNSRPVVEVESEIATHLKETRTGGSAVKTLSQMPDSDGLEYFDGYRVSKPLFVYEDDFGPREFDQRLSEIDEICASIFNETVDSVGIDTEQIDSAVESGRNTADTDSVAFQ